MRPRAAALALFALLALGMLLAPGGCAPASPFARGFLWGALGSRLTQE